MEMVNQTLLTTSIYAALAIIADSLINIIN